MNKKIGEQVQELVAFGRFDPVVARDRETATDEMRGCDTAVIHVGADGLLFDGGQNEGPRIRGDILIEIGAAMADFVAKVGVVERGSHGCSGLSIGMIEDLSLER